MNQSLNAGDASAKIVIGVDDAAENLKMIEAVVVAGGYSFLGVSSGSECLSLLTRVAPRLILLDIEMPGMSGFETCRKIRRSPELDHVPVAFLTARHGIDDVKEGIAAGGNDFIVKPFDVLKLIERIKHWTTRTIHA
jgi:two-component system OmpR family response regulator